MKFSKEDIRMVLISLAFALFILVLLLLISCNNRPIQNVAQNPLSDSMALPQAIELYEQMKVTSSDYIMLGHQDALAYGIGWRGAEFKSDIQEVCGDYPAVFGWDLGHISDKVNIDSVPFDEMKRWAKEVHKRGGINTYSWHTRNIISGGSSWDTSTKVSDILPGGDHHEAFVQQLDLVADFFNALRDEEGKLIPVLFRPWHEMNGGWFWWGSKSCSPSEFKTLWQFTSDYLRTERKLNNLIYIYSTDVFESRDEYLTYYPGDTYVDILGYDDYKGLHDRSQTHRTIKMLEILSDLAQEKNKLYTISEGGIETLPDSTWFTQVVLPTLNTNEKTRGLSYLLLWRNGRPDHFYAPYPGHSSVSDFIAFKNDSSILLLHELQKTLNLK